NREETMAPCGAYPCRGDDSWVALAVRSDDDWRRFGAVLGNPTWCSDPRFTDVVGRLLCQDELDARITEWTRTQAPYDVMKLLQAAGLPAAPFLTDEEVYQDPHLNARGFFELKTHREAGTHRYPGAVWKYTQTPM